MRHKAKRLTPEITPALFLVAGRSADTGSHLRLPGASLLWPRRRIFGRPRGWWAAPFPRQVGFSGPRATAAAGGATSLADTPL